MTFEMYIDGRWTKGTSGEMLPLISPATGEELGRVPKGTRGDVAQAVAAARKAQPAFAALTTFERAKLCHRVADAIHARREEIAHFMSLEQGKPLRAEALGEVDVAARMYRMAAEDALRMEGTVMPSEEANKRILTIRQPRGVYGIITPWNFPIAVPTEYISAGIVTGNSLVWIPAPSTAGCAVKLMECLVEAGVPAGIVNLITGDGAVVGDEVAGHDGIDAIGFTGSSGIGLAVSRRAAGKPQLLELGGNAPTIVLADADVARAAKIAGRGAFWNAGQICDSTERILVHRSVHRKFVDELVRITSEFQMGNPLESATTLGPVHNARQVQHVERHLRDAVERGAKVLVGGAVADKHPTRLYFPATVVDDVRPDMLFNREETFGPVAPVLTFENEEEAIAIANGSPTGLLASVFTSDLRKAIRIGERLQAGIVNLNEGSAYWQPHTPFGGFSGKTSGVGRLGGKYTLLEMTQVKTLVIDLGDG